MENTFLNEMKQINNVDLTENGGITRKTTNSKVLDMFSLGGAYRNRSDADVILLFQNAIEENAVLAIKCLFYLRDVRGGQGERRFFRVAFKWLCNAYPKIARKNLVNVSDFGRWDDLIYATEGTPLQDEAFDIIKMQLALDCQCKTPSLLAKWMPSQNASNAETKRLGRLLAAHLGLTNRQYRKVLSYLRNQINIVERLMSENRWDEIEFDKIPSRAGMIYKNAFARRDVIAKKYEAFAKDTNTKVNAEVLYPQDIAHKVFAEIVPSSEDPRRLMLQKYWDNLKDYYRGRKENGIAIVDTSGSMLGAPLEAAVSLGAYIADKAHGPFAHHFITFSDKPSLVEFKGVDIYHKFRNCHDAQWGFSTNIEAVFDMLLTTAKKKRVKKEDMPTRLYIFSDMEFNSCVQTSSGYCHSQYDIDTDLEIIKEQWAAEGYELPQVIFWNLDARHNHIPAIGKGFSYVSGFSPNMVECILSGKDGYDLMLEKLMSDRYAIITV